MTGDHAARQLASVCCVQELGLVDSQEGRSFSGGQDLRCVLAESDTSNHRPIVGEVHSAAPTRVLICATNNLPEVAEQVANQTLAVITFAGLHLVPAVAPVTAP